MAADVAIYRLTGAGPTPDRIDAGGDGSTRASTSDNHYVAQTDNPIPIPPSGTTYSFWVVTRLGAVTSPSGTINNLKWYTDGTNSWTGVGVEVNTATAYTQATGTVGTDGNVLNTTNYPSLAGATSDAFTYNSGSPLSVTGSITNPTTGEFGDRVVFQLGVTNTAAAGTLADETFTWQYDET